MTYAMPLPYHFFFFFFFYFLLFTHLQIFNCSQQKFILFFLKKKHCFYRVFVRVTDPTQFYVQTRILHPVKIKKIFNNL